MKMNVSDFDQMEPDNSTTEIDLDQIIKETYWLEKIIKNSITIFAYSLIFIVSLFGNVLVCYIIFSKRKMRTKTNLLIANLTFSDLLMTLINIPFNLLRLLLDNWIFGGFMCKFLPFVQVTSVYVFIHYDYPLYF